MLKLSIIIATYNAQNYIGNALMSVIEQSFTDWECLVVDGHSSDKTINLVEEYEKNDSRIRHISEKDCGIYDAFNKGYRMAKGEWIYYLGADDCVLRDGFMNLFPMIQRSDAIVYGNVIYKSNSGLKKKLSNVKIDDVRVRLNCSHQGFVMRRDVIEKMDGFRDYLFALSADYDLILRSYLKGYKMEYYNVDIATFDVRGASSSYEMEWECYKIRRINKSVGFVYNLFLLLKHTASYFGRKLYYRVQSLLKKFMF